MLKGLDHDLGAMKSKKNQKWNHVIFGFIYCMFLKTDEDLKQETSCIGVYHFYKKVKQLEQ